MEGVSTPSSQGLADPQEILTIQRLNFVSGPLRQALRQAAFTSRNKQVTGLERSKDTVTSPFIGPLSRPQLNRFSALNASGGQKAANLPVINFSLFEDEQRQIVRMVRGHPRLNSGDHARGADAVWAACGLGESVFLVDGLVVV